MLQGWCNSPACRSAYTLRLQRVDAEPCGAMSCAASCAAAAMCVTCGVANPISAPRLPICGASPHLQAQHDEVERAAMQRRTDEKARRVEAIEASRSALLAEMQRIKKDIQQQEAMLKAGSRSNQGQAQLGQLMPWLQDLSRSMRQSNSST